MSWVSQGLHALGDWASALTVRQIAEVAPIVTASLTVLAVLFAWRAIHVQRDVARRRAAIDFFLKAEMDKDTLALWKTFREKSVLFSQWAQSPHFKDEPGYHDVRMFLNVCELIAVGIRHKAFSKKVSQAYWGDVLPDAYQKAKALIQTIRKTPGEGTKHTYSDLQWLCRKWS